MKHEIARICMVLEVLLQFPALHFLDLMLITTSLRYAYYFELSAILPPFSILFISLMDVYFLVSNDASNRFGNFIKHLTRSTNEVPRSRGCFRFIVPSINALYHPRIPGKTYARFPGFFSQQVTFVAELGFITTGNEISKIRSVHDSTVRSQAVN